MKSGIFIAVAAMAFALVSTPDVEAKGWGWHHGLHMKVAGSNFIVSNLEDGTPTPANMTTTSIASGIVKGGGGGLFSSQNVAQGVADLENPFDPRCEGTPLPLGNDFATTIVITRYDGSILSLETVDSHYCTDGVTFVAYMGGNVLGGEGRYEGATGTWEGVAQVFQSRVTGTIDVDLD